MEDHQHKTREELIEEVEDLRRRLDVLEKSETERRRMEEALKISESGYRRIVDTAREGIWVLDKEYFTTFVNRRMAEMLGYEPGEMIGKRHDYFLFEEDLADLDEKTAMRRQGVSGRYERRLRRKDGGTVWAHASASPILDEENRFVGSFAMFTDITERKQTEEALLASEKKYRSIFQNAVEGIFQSTPDGHLITVNPGMARIHGYASPQEMVAMVTSIGDQIYTNIEDRRRFRQILEEHGVVRGFEARFYRKDGSELWGSLNVRAVKDRDGKVLFHEGIMEDITARKDAEEALRESESKFRTLFNTATDAIYLHEISDDGTPGRFVETNDVICSRLGYTREEMLAMTPLDIDGREEAVHMGRIMKGLIRDGAARFEMTHVTREGMGIPVEISSRLLSLTDQKMVLSIARDITERKRAEEELRKSEEKYRDIFENAVEGIYQVTPEGRYLSVNPALARIHGFSSPDEMLGSVTDIAHQLYVDPSRRARLRSLMETEGYVKAFEIMLRRKDGSLHWVSNTAHAVRGENGAILYYEGTIEDITTRKFAEEELQHLRITLEGTIEAMSLMAEAKDPGAPGHQKRVSLLASRIAAEMGFPADMAERMRVAGMIHDIGKIVIPTEILSKPGRLTDMEFRLVTAHPRAGYDIVRRTGLAYPVPDAILQHHERLNGSGYPEGLKGSEILLEARILAVADVVEAMVSPRPYHPARTMDAALLELKTHQGTLYDPDVVEACIRLCREKKFFFD